MGTVVVVFSGEYDLGCKTEFTRQLRRLASEPNVVLDLSDVTYMDSWCVSEMLSWHRRRADKGFERETIIVRTPLMRRLFSILELERFFTIVPSWDAALAGGSAHIEYAFGGAKPERFELAQS